MPTQFKDGILATDTLKLRLQNHNRVTLLAHAHYMEARAVQDALLPFGIRVMSHTEACIIAIRRHIKQLGDNVFPDKINWQWDDDIICFNDLTVRPRKRFRDPKKIVKYMDFLYENAKLYGVVGMFGPTQNGEWFNREQSKLNRFSHFCTNTGIVGYMPKSSNPYPDGIEVTNMEETIAVLALRGLIQGTGHKAALRDNATEYISHPASPQDPKSPERRHALKTAIDMFGIKTIRFLHKKEWPLIEEITKNANNNL